ncbi:MAG TPA: hypothetical protein VF459_13310, partial [Caulobacteraceae bacterium]
MSAGAPKHHKGLDSRSREVAADLARQSGMSLSEWVDRLLADDGPEDAISQDYFAPAAGDAAYLETPRGDRAAPSRIEVPEHPADEVSRVAQALDRLSQRIEAAERRSTLAISGVDQTVRGVLSRLETTEREQTAVAARFEGAVQEVQSEQARVADRMRRIEAEANGPRSAEALRSLEGALGKVASHLYDGESRTRDALAEMRSRVDRFENDRGESVVEAVVSRLGQRLEQAEAKTSGALTDLRASFAALDGRLNSVEGGGTAGNQIDARLETLAANLTSRVDAARAEMAERLKISADTRFDRMDRTLSEMSEHVRAAEQRSAQAIEKMGREVIDMAENLSRRVNVVEHRSADAIEQVGGEVARIAQAMETKLGRADTVQAQALEKLGVEIARISERLAERISNSERRSAQAIDDVGEQVARVTERISQRHERTSGELADRIRQSEERTAKLLEEAREKLEKLSADTQRRLPDRRNAFDADEGLFVEEDFPSFQPPPPAEVAYAAPAYRQVVSSPVAYGPVVQAPVVQAPVVQAPVDAAAAVVQAWEAEPAAFSEEDFVAADAFPAEAYAPDAGSPDVYPAEPLAEAVAEESAPGPVGDLLAAAARDLDAEPVHAEPIDAGPLAPFDFEEDEQTAAALELDAIFEEEALFDEDEAAIAAPQTEALFEEPLLQSAEAPDAPALESELFGAAAAEPVADSTVEAAHEALFDEPSLAIPEMPAPETPTPEAPIPEPTAAAPFAVAEPVVLTTR